MIEVHIKYFQGQAIGILIEMEGDHSTCSSFTLLDVVSSGSGIPWGVYRILVEPKTVKYLMYPEDKPMLPNYTALLDGVLEVPSGSWNVGYLARDEKTGLFCLTHTEQKELASVAAISAQYMLIFSKSFDCYD